PPARRRLEPRRGPGLEREHRPPRLAPDDAVAKSPLLALRAEHDVAHVVGIEVLARRLLQDEGVPRLVVHRSTRLRHDRATRPVLRRRDRDRALVDLPRARLVTGVEGTAE